MPKFCENCGTKLNEEQDVCLSCGKVIRKNNVEAPEKKKNHNVFFTTTGVIMIVLSVCLFAAYSGKSDDEIAMMVYGFPALFALVGAIVELCGKKNKSAIIIAAIIYIGGGVINMAGISDISIYTILAWLFAGFMIYYASKME